MIYKWASFLSIDQHKTSRQKQKKKQNKRRVEEQKKSLFASLKK